MASKISNVNDGGYEAQFVEEVPDYLLCTVCHLALKSPIQIIKCGHRFCEVCFNKMKNDSTER